MTAKKNHHAVALGRKGGKATSTAKAESSRTNGRLGGRPKIKGNRDVDKSVTRQPAELVENGPRVPTFFGV